MEPCQRRWFLTFSATALAAPLALTEHKAIAAGSSQLPAMVLLTDLFRPHGDPDDHWDLATVFALASQKRCDFRAVVIDYPPPRRGKTDPDVLAVAQLNYLTGLAVPTIVGCPRDVRTRTDSCPEATPQDLAGVRALLQLLRRSPAPVVLHVVGTCNDVAIACRREPRLFAEKCAAIYLNAGAGTPDAEKAKKLEYNVALNPAAYAAMFDVPCPLYWLPCFEIADDFRQPATYGSYYRFRQADILPQLAPRLQNYFLGIYRDGSKEAREHGPHAAWLRTLLSAPDLALLAQESTHYRNMWCTAGFLHSVGLTVSSDGSLLPLAEAHARGMFEFVPISVECGNDGVTRWQTDTSSKNRFLLRLSQPQQYAQAMTAALKAVLMPIGRDGQ